MCIATCGLAWSILENFVDLEEPLMTQQLPQQNPRYEVPWRELGGHKPGQWMTDIDAINGINYQSSIPSDVLRTA